ncbi:10646_t:CDS:1, partial [Racocetra fulgida]
EKFRSVIIDNSIEELSSCSNTQNIELIKRNTNEIELKLTQYKKTFDSALMLYKREKNNVHFVKNFDNLLKPVVKAIEE